jgi:hypothetical protein
LIWRGFAFGTVAKIADINGRAMREFGVKSPQDS